MRYRLLVSPCDASGDGASTEQVGTATLRAETASEALLFDLA